jgi:hypothetical protein
MFEMIEPKPEKKTKEVKVSAIYLPNRQWQMLELSWVHLGYSPRTIAKNALQGFFAANKQYYVNAALRDAQSREISQQEHYRILRDGQSLPRIIQAADHPASPIAWVPDLVSNENKRRYNTIELSAFNYTLLQVAVVLDGGSLPSVVSKCIYAHLGEAFEPNPSDNLKVGAWAKNYYPQITLNEKALYRED